jgi:hypothetical protein
VVVVAIVVRLAVWQAFPGVFDFATTGTIHGSEAYDHYAQNLLATGVYGRERGVADAAIPPVYSAVLAAAYAVFGRSGATVALLHTAFDAASLLLLGSIGRALFSSPWVGLLAALGMAVYPYFVFQSLAVNDTSLFVLLLHGLVWLVVRLRRPMPPGRAAAATVLAGVVLALATLTRPVILPLGVWAAAWWWLRLPARAVGQRLLVLGVAAALVIGAWSVRNQRVLDARVVIATNGGSNFWQGNNALTRPYLAAGYDVQWIPAGALAHLDFRDPAGNGAFFAEGLRYWREHPHEVGGLLWTKLQVHWSLDIAPRRNPASEPGVARGLDDVRADRSGASHEVALTGLAEDDAVSAYSRPLFDRYGRLVHRVYWGGALALALLGLWTTRRAWRAVSLVWMVQINMTLAYVLFHPSTRYRLPSDPLLMLFSAAGFLALLDARRRLGRARGATAGARDRARDALTP